MRDGVARWLQLQPETRSTLMPSSKIHSNIVGEAASRRTMSRRVPSRGSRSSSASPTSLSDRPRTARSTSVVACGSLPVAREPKRYTSVAPRAQSHLTSSGMRAFNEAARSSAACRSRSIRRAIGSTRSMNTMYTPTRRSSANWAASRGWEQIGRATAEASDLYACPPGPEKITCTRRSCTRKPGRRSCPG